MLFFAYIFILLKALIIVRERAADPFFIIQESSCLTNDLFFFGRSIVTKALRRELYDKLPFFVIRFENLNFFLLFMVFSGFFLTFMYFCVCLLVILMLFKRNFQILYTFLASLCS